jgi:hypothetical protein
MTLNIRGRRSRTDPADNDPMMTDALAEGVWSARRRALTKAMLPEPQTTNLGVRSSNLFGRGRKPVKSPGEYKRKYQDLTDDRIDAAIDFETRGIVWDKQVPGLRLYIGKRKVSWQFYADTRDHGGKRHK